MMHFNAIIIFLLIDLALSERIDPNITTTECDLPLDMGHCNWTHRPRLRISWYFDSERDECLAFGYSSCGGNSNRFRSKSDCADRCQHVDGSICVLNASVPGLDAFSTSSNPCDKIKCPLGYRCKRGWLENSAACCNSEVEDMYTMSHTVNGLCTQWPVLIRGGTIVTGASCSTMYCPRGYQCVGNALYANCCPMPRQKRDMPPSDYDRTTMEDDEAPAYDHASMFDHDRSSNAPLGDIHMDLDEDNSSIQEQDSFAWVNGTNFQGDIAGFQNQTDFEEYIESVVHWEQRHELKHVDDGRLYSAIRNPRGLWKQGRVPYEIHSRNRALHLAVRAAIEEFDQKTCIRFVRRTNEQYFIRIFDNDPKRGCWSLLGNKHNPIGQPLSLSGPDCWKKGTVVHELMHAIGFWHEHQCTDRDQYVDVIKQNIELSCFDINFRKATASEMKLIGNYDLNSIMHYPSDACVKDHLRHDHAITLKIKNSNRPVPDIRKGLTGEDVRKIRELYNCDGNTTIDLEQEIESECPKTANSYFTDASGRPQRMCAKVYDQSHCRGFSLGIVPGERSLDLGTVRMSQRPNWNWNKEISSLEVNPKCSITVCSQVGFASDCHTFHGDTAGRNKDTIPIAREISSLKCDCAKCPTISTKDWTNKNRERQPVCGTIYDRVECGGKSKRFSVWWASDLQSESRPGGESWYHNVRAAEINPGCTMKFCTGHSWTGTCTIKEGGVHGKNIQSFGHQVGSLWCTCNSGADERGYQTVRRTRPVPSPSGGHRVCAVAVEMFRTTGRNLWIKVGEVVNNRDQRRVFAYTYLATSRKCTLYHCEGENFMGKCQTVEPNNYGPEANALVFYGLKSYRCTCA